jgi:hypothetical protein
MPMAHGQNGQHLMLMPPVISLIVCIWAKCSIIIVSAV